MNRLQRQTRRAGMTGSAPGLRAGNSHTGLARPRQEGITTVGFLILAVFIGLFAFAFIRLAPVYLNYMKVVGLLEGVHEEFDSQNASRNAIRTSIVRRFNVESVSEIEPSDIKVTSDSDGFTVAAVYDHTTPFIGNISFTVHFDKKVLVRR